jgi:antitoxin VapB
MNIKNEETHRLAQELAAATGESLTKAVTVAVRERLERVRGIRTRRMADRLLAIGADCVPRLGPLPDHGDMLYGPDGLPK